MLSSDIEHSSLSMNVRTRRRSRPRRTRAAWWGGTANVAWLARYRHPRCADPPGLASLLLEVFTGPGPLMAGAAAAGDPMAVLPALFRLMWRHALTADLTARLTAETPVAAGAAPGGAR